MSGIQKVAMLASLTMFAMNTQAKAASEIVTPPAGTVWTEGAVKSIAFAWEYGCSGYTVKVIRESDDEVLFSTNHGLPTGNPEVYTFIVPDPDGTSGTEIPVIIEVEYTQLMGTRVKITQEIKIKNSQYYSSALNYAGSPLVRQ
ncbi:hypothetical protein FGO68_gene10117 [Halteria grandinella]|uniref:Uncharacterized protein n=1 Tax=Halteria grandinella TaxID=5974 RepID=A0A8J8NAJ0_HALGN|nr:hypothetical protein FGO68_gene10117 [Halteria grandinella]